MKLVCKDLSVQYDDKTAINHISLEVQTGRCVSIIGPNGSGKTTLVKAMNQLIPYTGHVLLDGNDVSSFSQKEISSYFAWMAQFSSTYFSYTVQDVVAMGQYVQEKKEDITPILDQVGIEDIRHRSLDTLSGGQLQKVLFARTLAQRTPFIFLDEPFNHMDLKVQADLLKLLEDWLQGSTVVDGKKIDHTLICVLHDLNTALHIGDDILLLNEGKCVSYTREHLNEAFDMDVQAYMKRLYEFWKE